MLFSKHFFNTFYRKMTDFDFGKWTVQLFCTDFCFSNPSQIEPKNEALCSSVVSLHDATTWQKFSCGNLAANFSKQKQTYLYPGPALPESEEHSFVPRPKSSSSS